MHRRDFLKGAGGPLLAAATPGLGWAQLLPKLQDGAAGLSRGQWETLAAVQVHMLPSETDSPGAREVQATAYLYYALTAPGIRAEEAVSVGAGVERLERLCLEMTSKGFAAADSAAREQVLRKLEQDKDGERWLAAILNYLLEALLADPAYGGNPGGIGWRWLEHRHGFPTPPTEKLWYRL